MPELFDGNLLNISVARNSKRFTLIHMSHVMFCFLSFATLRILLFIFLSFLTFVRFHHTTREYFYRTQRDTYSRDT